MKKYSLIVLAISFALVSCGTNGPNHGDSTPIDSTNVYGSAPAKYGGNDPAKDTDNRNNVNDTGTKANTLHDEGTR